jgi:hypothetical protein
VKCVGAFWARTAAGFFLVCDLAFDILVGDLAFDCFFVAFLFDVDFFDALEAFLAAFFDAFLGALLDFLDLGCFFFGAPAAAISSSLAAFVCNCTARVDRKRQNTKTSMNFIKEQNANVALKSFNTFLPFAFLAAFFFGAFLAAFFAALFVSTAGVPLRSAHCLEMHLTRVELQEKACIRKNGWVTIK